MENLYYWHWNFTQFSSGFKLPKISVMLGTMMPGHGYGYGHDTDTNTEIRQNWKSIRHGHGNIHIKI